MNNRIIAALDRPELPPWSHDLTDGQLGALLELELMGLPTTTDDIQNLTVLEHAVREAWGDE